MMETTPEHSRDIDKFYMAWAMFELALENHDYDEAMGERMRDWIAKAKVHEKQLKLRHPDYYEKRGK